MPFPHFRVRIRIMKLCLDVYSTNREHETWTAAEIARQVACNNTHICVFHHGFNSQDARSVYNRPLIERKAGNSYLGPQHSCYVCLSLVICLTIS